MRVFQTLFLSFLILFSSCATDPGTNAPIGGSSVTFTYSNGDVDVIVSVQYPKIIAAAVLFDFDPATGIRGQAKQVETGVSIQWPDLLTLTVPNCDASASLASSETGSTFKLYNYDYPASCSPSETQSVSALATVVVSNGTQSRTINGAGSGGGTTITSHVIFASSTQSTGNLGGLSGADSTCANLAASGSATATLPGTWRAVLSSDVESAASRITFESGVSLTNTNGDTILALASNLFSGGVLSNAITFNQNGGSAAGGWVWTGTSGVGASIPSFTCNSWTSSSGLEFAKKGLVSATTSEWLSDAGNFTCDSTLVRLYCINSKD